MRGADYARRYRIEDGAKFRLKLIDPAETPGISSKEKAVNLLRNEVELLSNLQEKLYAQDRWALLLIFQAMDAAGKDSTVKHVMSGINPAGCQVYSFKAPSAEELDHDFLWRIARCMPERGRIGIFNRSYYEETLIVRVHKEILAGQRLPSSLVTKDIWKERFEDIVAYERYLTRNGIAVVKFFLHVSKAEQKRRFLERLEQPPKNWKFSLADIGERDRWGDYMEAYEDTIRNTARGHAPWYVVPADHKWYTRLVVSGAVIAALEDMKLAFPKIDDSKRRELAKVRAALTKRRS
jgi:PPK2 family polyphosphate:nucleotide phosphotransferase